MARTPLLFLLALLLAAGLADAAREIATSSSAKAKGATVPLTLEAGLFGATTFGANATYADTTLSDAWVLLSTTSLLGLEAGSPQNAQIRYVSATGLPRVSIATVKLAGTTQVRIDEGIVQQATGPAVPLLVGVPVWAGGDLRIEKGQNAALTLEIVSTNVKGTQVIETWILRLRG